MTVVSLSSISRKSGGWRTTLAPARAAAVEKDDTLHHQAPRFQLFPNLRPSQARLTPRRPVTEVSHTSPPRVPTPACICRRAHMHECSLTHTCIRTRAHTHRHRHRHRHTETRIYTCTQFSSHSPSSLSLFSSLAHSLARSLALYASVRALSLHARQTLQLGRTRSRQRTSQHAGMRPIHAQPARSGKLNSSSCATLS